MNSSKELAPLAFTSFSNIARSALTTGVSPCVSAAGQHNCTLDFAFEIVRANQRLYAHRACALPHKRYVVGIAAESTDVVSDPLDSGVLIVQSEIAFAMHTIGKKAEHVEAIVYRNEITPRFVYAEPLNCISFMLPPVKLPP